MSQTIEQDGTFGPATEAAGAVLRQVIEDWNRASVTWDADGLTACYWDDAMLFGGRPYLSAGRQGIRDYFASYSAQLARVGLVLSDQVVVEPAPDMLLAQGFGRFSFHLTSGADSAATMRTSLVLMRRAGRWKIQQHHFSNVPDKPPSET